MYLLTVAMGGGGSPPRASSLWIWWEQIKAREEVGGKRGYHIYSHGGHRQQYTCNWLECAPQAGYIFCSLAWA